MSDELIFSSNFAPDPTPSHIKVDGKCYELIEQTSETPTNYWDEIQGYYDSCADCLSKVCAHTWGIGYNCETNTWQSVQLISTDCVDDCLEVDWYFSHEDSNICYYQKITCPGDNCVEPDDCPAGTAPDAPTLPFECPCYNPSPSSSSSIPEPPQPSSSASPSPSSSASPGPGPGPIDDGRFI